MSDSLLSSRLGRDHATPNDFAREVAELRSSGTPVWDLTVTNPTRARLPRDWRPIHDALVSAAEDSYAPDGLGHLVAREQIASHLRRVVGDEHGFFDVGTGQEYAAERLMLTASTSDSYAYLFKALCNPGDCILVPEPSYPLLSHLASLEGLRVIAYRLNYDGAWYVDWASVEAGLRERPKAVVVVSPNNPTASCATAEEFDRFCACGVPVIVDQVFAPFVWRRSGASALPYDRSDALVFVLDGLSKRGALPQLKLGWIAVFGPASLAEPALGALALIGDTYLGVNGVTEAAVGRLLEVTTDTRRLVRARLSSNLEHLDALELAGAPFSRLHYQGGWSMMLRLPSYRTDDEWARRLLQRRVITQPGWLYDCPTTATLVLSLLTPEATFRSGLERLQACLE